MEASDIPQLEGPEVEETTNGDGDSAALFEHLRQKRAEIQPFGKTQVFPVPGYEGLLAVKYRYIQSEDTERIARRVATETRLVNGAGLTLLSSLDTLIAGCVDILIRDKVDDEWRPIDPHRPTKFDSRLAKKLGYAGEDEREYCLGLYGSEHAVTQENIRYSRWLADTSRDVEDDFLGL